MNNYFITSNSMNNASRLIDALNALSQVIYHPTIKMSPKNDFAVLHFDSEESLENIKNILKTNLKTMNVNNWITETN